MKLKYKQLIRRDFTTTNQQSKSVNQHYTEVQKEYITTYLTPTSQNIHPDTVHIVQKI